MPIKLWVTAERVKKTLSDGPMLPSFYVCPYADPDPGESDDYSLTYFPPQTIACDINLAFFVPSDNTAAGTYGNTVTDGFLCHLRDSSSIQQFATLMKTFDRRIFGSYIDSPTIHWSNVNRTNFARNTEGEITPDGTVLSNDLMVKYLLDGRMWDAETADTDFTPMANVMKECFLRGIQRAPDTYVFIYTTYADRPIDKAILMMSIDPNGDDVDQALFALGFRQISDFITLRGSLSFLETMSYSDNPTERFAEADNYAVKYLAKGDDNLLYQMRKFISIGVAPGLTNPTDANTIAQACNPTNADGYGRFMVWAANCPGGLSLFKSMVTASKQQSLLNDVTSQEERTLAVKTTSSNTRTPGNRNWFFPKLIPDSTHRLAADFEDYVVYRR